VPDFKELLVGADAVLCAGGHTALEAIHLGHRPIVLPVSWQKEQRWLADRLAGAALGWSVHAGVSAAELAGLVRVAGASLGTVLDRPAAERSLASGLVELDRIVHRTAESMR
jgi:predicted glycosyltransferase